MFVDASAIVAILTAEPDADAMANTLEAAPAPIASPVAIFEAVLGVCCKRHASVAEVQGDVVDFQGVAGVRTVPVTKADADAALSAYARYGKGRGHPAQLNLGDCFAYAVARTHRAALLFEGDDFTRTDIPDAMQPGR